MYICVCCHRSSHDVCSIYIRPMSKLHLNPICAQKIEHTRWRLQIPEYTRLLGVARGFIEMRTIEHASTIRICQQYFGTDVLIPLAVCLVELAYLKHTFQIHHKPFSSHIFQLTTAPACVCLYSSKIFAALYWVMMESRNTIGYNALIRISMIFNEQHKQVQLFIKTVKSQAIDVERAWKFLQDSDNRSHCFSNRIAIKRSTHFEQRANPFSF